MKKIPYSEQIRRGYNYLAGRVNELKTENEKLKAENAKLKADIFRANFGAELSREFSSPKLNKVWSDLYAKEIEVEDAKR
jgi:cell division protein FtsB